jgi:hypothetical protein
VERMVMALTTYQVRVSGTIPADLLAELSGMSVSVEPPQTVIHGELADQSALFGLISRMHGMGLRLIEIRRLPAREEPVTRPLPARVPPRGDATGSE